MRLHQGSFVLSPLKGECPSWETDLGQSKGDDVLPPYYFKAEGYENLLKGMFFNAVPLNLVSSLFGKKKISVTAELSYQNSECQEIQLASCFDKVIVHFKGKEKKYSNAPIILLLTKIQDKSKSHFGRRSIKYTPHTTYGEIKNSDSFEKIQSKYKERLSCYGFFVEHFDTLHLYCVDADEFYADDEWKEISLPETDWTDWAEWEKEERKNNPPQVNQESSPTSSPSFTPSQVIYYGVPGCGKSNKIKQDFENGNVDEEAQVVRCVFHPEYTNADFVGQIFPVVKKDGKGVDYKFKPGPFTEILRRAYLNPHTKFFLVIEEINRGNAAAIFGEMFQLLDRIKEGKDKSGFGPGWSSYSILNDDLNDYIRNIEAFDKFEHVGCVKPNLYKDMRDGNGNVVDAPDENGKKEIDFSTATSYSSLELTLQGFDVPQIFRESTSIRLPPNLSIYATMNTSDQNVFTLDNAFKRRFDSELIKNTLAGDEHKVQRETKIEGTSVTWGEFWEKINNLILEKNASMTSTEDKRLGAYFIVGDEKTDAAGNKYREVSKKLFGEKVLEYLWNDAFKFKHKDIFKEDCKSVESLIDNFEKGGFAAVFKNDEFTAATVQELKASDN